MNNVVKARGCCRYTCISLCSLFQISRGMIKQICVMFSVKQK